MSKIYTTGKKKCVICLFYYLLITTVAPSCRDRPSCLYCVHPKAVHQRYCALHVNTFTLTSFLSHTNHAWCHTFAAKPAAVLRLQGPTQMSLWFYTIHSVCVCVCEHQSDRGLLSFMPNCCWRSAKFFRHLAFIFNRDRHIGATNANRARCVRIQKRSTSRLEFPWKIRFSFTLSVSFNNMFGLNSRSGQWSVVSSAEHWGQTAAKKKKIQSLTSRYKERSGANLSFTCYHANIQVLIYF